MCDMHGNSYHLNPSILRGFNAHYPWPMKAMLALFSGQISLLFRLQMIFIAGGLRQIDDFDKIPLSDTKSFAFSQQMKN